MQKIRAFTLIELLVVITIIGILAVGGFQGYKSQTQKARDSKRIQDIKILASGVEQYEIDNGDIYLGETNETDAGNNENIQNFRDAHEHYVPNIQNIYDPRPRGNRKCRTAGAMIECLYIYRYNSSGYKVSTYFESRSNVCNQFTNEKCFATEDGGRYSDQFEMGTNLGASSALGDSGVYSQGLNLYKSN